MPQLPDCPLCSAHNESVLYQNRELRIILVTDQALTPAYCRVIWQAHCAEMTDLSPDERERLMAAVYAVERALRDCVCPDKINLASFGTMVPHQHWHVIARFKDDAYYPDAIWAAAKHRRVPELPTGWCAHLQQRLQDLLSDFAKGGTS